VVAVWNFFGFALLVNIVAIAVVSTPLFRWFGDERVNVFVTYPPFVWLPGVLVMAAPRTPSLRAARTSRWEAVLRVADRET
jgi:hypothetical protein